MRIFIVYVETFKLAIDQADGVTFKRLNGNCIFTLRSTIKTSASAGAPIFLITTLAKDWCMSFYESFRDRVLFYGFGVWKLLFSKWGGSMSEKEHGMSCYYMFELSGLKMFGALERI